MNNIKRVKVASGFVEGQVQNVLGRHIVQFLCIPYCKPPIGELRFQKPQPCEFVSNGVINKLNFETCPPQPFQKPYDSENKDEEVWIPKERDDEDSLYVNIWCPLDILEMNDKAPVFVFIYGGGFVSGSSSLDVYNGSILSSLENIIVVSFNYRISMLGFLCLDEQIRGNFGIWDQVLALKWIHQNISTFNGDQENITICGSSAGGCSVSLHLLINESWPHFNKVIMLSGVCLSDWGCLPKKELNRRSIISVNKILRKHDFPLSWEDADNSNEDKKSIIKFLQEIDLKEFLVDFDISNGIVQFPWATCVDGELIKEDPKTLYERGNFKKCPTVFLNVENEGSLFILLEFANIEVDRDKLISPNYFHDCFKYYPHWPNRCEDHVKEQILKEYKVQEEHLTIDILNKIVSDQHFVCGSIELANIVSRFHEDVYYLWFRTPITNSNWPDWCGVIHSDEIYYLFGEIIKNESRFSDAHKEGARFLMKQFHHFISNGHFLNSMPKYDSFRRYISIEENLWTSKSFSEDQLNKVAFWKNLKDS